MDREALFYDLEKDKIHCKLCPHNCRIPDNKIGICKVRKNIGGKLYSLNYGEVTSIARDPIEKKPLYHFKPGSNILSIGSFGCNFTCDFCQNYSISQDRAESRELSPEELYDICLSLKDNIGVAFTYNEPSIWYEYVYDCSKFLKEKIPDIKIVLVSNGYIQSEPLLQLLPYIDAANIDLKAFSNRYYNRVCGGRLEPVLDTIKLAADKCHMEITTLLVTGENDSMDEVEEISRFIAEIDKDIPLHISRYFPRYKMNNPATEVGKMSKAYEVARNYLNYVYLGNVDLQHNSTYCPKCGFELINRSEYRVRTNINGENCPNCGYIIKVVN